ncbi:MULTISPECIES: hypothetical protein [Spirulina sp. CCY15215]|uniref:hypothetical protein n=1 Tax=Spirulina sp. CCY15215 TaxID=2767591 RepID=UPI001952642E
MKFTPIDPPRVFEVGFGEIIPMKDCARVALDPDEQVTFVTESGGEYDLARKSWGFYATPSLNGRLEKFNLRGVLVKNRLDRYFVLLVERGKEDLFQRYLEIESLAIVCWLDNTDRLKQLEESLNER